MKKKEHAESLKRSDLLRQKRQREQSEWLHTVDSRAERMASRTAAEAYEETQRDFRPLRDEKNPLTPLPLTTIRNMPLPRST